VLFKRGFDGGDQMVRRSVRGQVQMPAGDPVADAQEGQARGPSRCQIMGPVADVEVRAWAAVEGPLQ
jgi:hypothetical protein